MCRETGAENIINTYLAIPTKATKNLRYLRDLLFKESAINSVALFIWEKPVAGADAPGMEFWFESFPEPVAEPAGIRRR